jgi:Holliday junction resolvase RusA-like endonuclease
MWTLKQFVTHPKYHKLIGVNKNSQPPKVNKFVDNKSGICIDATCTCITFTAKGKPVGKPRMTRRDKWQQRACVLRYRDFCDRLRAVAPCNLNDFDCFAIKVVAYIAVKDSWSEKRKKCSNGTPHRSKPDADNILKAVGDALFKDDSGLWDVQCKKYWCLAGDERTDITVHFNRKN